MFTLNNGSGKLSHHLYSVSFLIGQDLARHQLIQNAVRYIYSLLEEATFSLQNSPLGVENIL